MSGSQHINLCVSSNGCFGPASSATACISYPTLRLISISSGTLSLRQDQSAQR